AAGPGHRAVVLTAPSDTPTCGESGAGIVVRPRRVVGVVAEGGRGGGGARGGGAPGRVAEREATEAETMEELLAGIQEDERALRPLRPGEIVEGVVASVSGDEALVDLGGRSAGVLSLREASAEGTDVAVGDTVIAA